VPEQTCARCGGTGYVIVERDGLSGANRCTCFEDHLNAQRIPRAGIPDKFVNATFENFSVGQSKALGDIRWEVKSYATQYEPDWRKPGLLIIGSPGIGKTHLAIAAFKQLLTRGFDGLFFDYQTLLDRIRAGWNKEAGVSERQAYQTALDAPILLLDDLGSRRSIEWVEDTVTAILTDRCNRNRTLIATANLPLQPALSGRETPAGEPRYGKTLSEVIGLRATSRLQEMCRIIQMPELPDYRPNIRN